MTAYLHKIRRKKYTMRI